MQGWVCTIGFFDGVHRGHQFLIRQVRDEALCRGVPSLLITFDRHPRTLLDPEGAPQLLTSMEEKMRLLQATGVDAIRVLTFAFLLEGIPSNTATHLARHVHAIPFISSLRNDRQSAIDGDTAPRNTPVNMIWYVNAEELQIIANKRLCNKAAEPTRRVVKKICDLAEEAMPELRGLLVPDCERHQGKCFEIDPCWRATNT